MTRKIPLTLVLLVLWAAQAQSASLSYVATFESQWLQELHTEDADICVFGDSDCYPAPFRIDPGLAPALMPFAGLTQGTKLPVTLSLDSTGDSGTCWIGGLFTCPADATAVVRRDPSGALNQISLASGLDDTDLVFRLADQQLQFTSAAGSFAPTGCFPVDNSALLPEGFCDFFGYRAVFSLQPTDDTHTPSIAVVPLQASAGYALLALGVLGLGGAIKTRAAARRRRD